MVRPRVNRSNRVKFIFIYEYRLHLIQFILVYFGFYLLKINIQNRDTLLSCHQVKIYQSEPVTYAFLKLIFWFQHNLACCVYPRHIKIQIFEAITPNEKIFSNSFRKKLKWCRWIISCISLFEWLQIRTRLYSCKHKFLAGGLGVFLQERKLISSGYDLDY